MASCLISSKEKIDDNLNRKNNIYQNIITLINYLNIDFGQIEKCMNKIIINLNSKEDDYSQENTKDEENPLINFNKDNFTFLTNIYENNFEKKEKN